MEFASGTDPRRRPLERPGMPLPPPLSRGVIPPGSIHSEQTPRRGLIASQINFDRAAFVYDNTSYLNYFVKAQNDPVSPGWTKLGGGGGGNDARAYIGPTSDPLYAWVWATFMWKNSGTAGDSARVTAALYQSGLAGQVAYARSVNFIGQHLPFDGNYRAFSYLGFFQIPVVPGAEWYVGLQQQFVDVGQNTQSIGRQSIIAFVSAVPDDGAENTTADGTLA